MLYWIIIIVTTATHAYTQWINQSDLLESDNHKVGKITDHSEWKAKIDCVITGIEKLYIE